MNRRSFLSGLIAAPAVVSFGSLMPVRGIIMPIEPLDWEGLERILPPLPWKKIYEGISFGDIITRR